MKAPGDDASTRALPRRGTAAWPAVTWCGLFALLHVFWAAGGSAGLASASGNELAHRRPEAFVLFGLWGLALLLAAGAVLAPIGIHGPITPGWRRAFEILAWIVAVVLVLRGLYVELALAVDLGHLRTSVGPLETRWSLLVWNPWFVIGGACFLALALEIRRRGKLFFHASPTATRTD